MKALIIIILVAVAGYFGYRYFAKSKSPPPPLIEAEAEPEPAQQPVVLEKKAPAATNAPMTNVSVARKPAVQQPTTPKPTGEWKAKLDRILASGGSSEQKLSDLKDMLSKLEEAEAEEAVQALTGMVQNEGYGFIKPLAVDPTLPEPVRDEFMVDMMNRPNSIKMPLFLEIARNPNHPDNDSAQHSLEAFTGLKYGADWTSWEKGIEAWLKENPDRPPQPQAPPQAN